MKRKWPTDLKTVRTRIAKAQTDLAAVAELMETIASLDVADQWPLFSRQGELNWELRQLEDIRARLVEQSWQTAPQPTTALKVTKA